MIERGKQIDTVERDGNRRVLEVDAEIIANVLDLIESEQRGMVLNIIADLYPADIAALLEHLPMDTAKRMFRWLTIEQGSEVLTDLDDDFRAGLLDATRPQRLAALIDEMDTDDAADVLADLPDQVAQEVLPDLADAENLTELLGYAEDTAGGLMTTEYVAVPGSWTVSQVTEEVRKKAEVVEPIHAIYVTDNDGRHIGSISLTRLLLSRESISAASIIDLEAISVPTEIDQEDVARIMARYDLISLPVVNDSDQIVGRITIDDIVDVIREEAEEDIQRMSGVAGGEEPTDSVLRVSRGRLPWLLMGMIGAGLSAKVIYSFEEALQSAVVLAAFIPIVMATAGNAGIQSSAIAVQGLAAGDIWTSDIKRRFGKELAVSIINGLLLALAMAIGVIVFFRTDQTAELAVTASLTIVIVIIVATLIGAMVPLILNKAGIDPALATGPFITAMNDILGIAVFFMLASWLYLGVT
ncbi:MAG: magnesium transporter [Rhodothermales bacterium]|nr:magnesium transporter [Rhodothermales bacterium]